MSISSLNLLSFPKFSHEEDDSIFKKSEADKSNAYDDPDTDRSNTAGLRDCAADSIVHVDHHQKQSEKQSKSSRNCINLYSEAYPACEDHHDARTKVCVHIGTVLPLHAQSESYLESLVNNVGVLKQNLTYLRLG